MADSNDTQNTPATTFASMLAEAGFVARTRKMRLTFGADVAAAFTDANVSDIILVASDATEDYTRKVAKMADSIASVLVLAADSNTASSIAGHLTRTADTRKVAWDSVGVTILDGVKPGGVDKVGMAVHVTRRK
jgi:hypothetical protein